MYKDFTYVFNNKIIEEFNTKIELECFSNIFRAIRSAYHISTTLKKRIEDLEFIFNNPEFEKQSNMIGLSVELLRIRLCYQLYLNNITIKFGSFIVESKVSKELIGEILLGSDLAHFLICRFIYRHPSVNKKTLIGEFEHRITNISKVLNDLIKRDIVGLRQENLYLIGRNPIKYNLKRFQWSSQWNFK